MFILILLVPLILGCRRVKNDKEIFGVETTKALKGLFASGVVLHHLCTYFCPPITSIGFYRNLGFVMVSGFFMISGYGLTFSAANKPNYLRGFLIKRVLPIITGYYLAAFGYCLMYRHYHALSWEMFRTIVTGANYWFIYAILIMYVGFYLAFRFFKIKNAAYVCSVWILLYMAFMYVKSIRTPGIYGFWWFNSCPAFLFGMWFCLKRESVLNILRKSYTPKLAVCAAVFAAAFAGVYLIEDKSSNAILLCEFAASVAFSVLVVQFSLKFKTTNRVLSTLGTVSLELYLIQALWIYVIGNEYTSYVDALLRVLNIIVRTVVTAYVLHYENRGVMWAVNKAARLCGLLPKQNSKGGAKNE